MADTARDLVRNALLDLGVIADEETPTASEAVGGLRKLNNLIESLNIENLMVFGATQNVFPLSPATSPFTLGPGGDFDIPRPNNILNAAIRDPIQNGIDFPLYIYNQDEYADLLQKGLTSSLPQVVYFDYTYPLINVYLWPFPSTSQYSLVLWTAGILSTFALDDVIALPPGYKRMLESNLAIELASSYQVEPTAAIVKIAQDSKNNLKTQNLSINELMIDPRLAGETYFDYRTGY